MIQMVAPLDHEFCYAVIARRDRSFEGKFWVGVLTTGVFCRPGCSARTPLAKNVRFFDSIEAAVAAGFRPCLRCRPGVEEPVPSGHLPAMRKLCRLLREYCDQDFSAERMAETVGLSTSHFPRVFRDCIGVSPREYAEACRSQRFRKLLKSPRPVGEAIEQSGYGSPSRVYEHTSDRLGMTPGQFKKGGEGVGVSYVPVVTPLGLMLLAATDRGVCWVQFGDSENELRARLAEEYPRAELIPMDPAAQPWLEPWIEALQRHLNGDRQRFDGLPLDIAGTAFQEKVWRYLTTVPAGQVRSYSDVASEIGHPTSVRAVARACATNRIAVFIPCHRVLRGSGELAGYRWGIDRKRTLLQLEMD